MKTPRQRCIETLGLEYNYGIATENAIQMCVKRESRNPSKGGARRRKTRRNQKKRRTTRRR
jgi:hypothetical protein